MIRTRIKIDGICRPEDAAAAARAGADAVGIVLDPTAKRYVAPGDAGKILAAVPPFVTTVGIFVDASADEIKSILRGLPFSAVQLHGDESPQIVADLKPVPVIKALHLSAGDTATLAHWRAAIRDLQLTNLVGLLLETADGAARSGTTLFPSPGTPGEGEGGGFVGQSAVNPHPNPPPDYKGRGISFSGPRGGTGAINDFMGLAEFQKSGAFIDLPAIILAGGLTSQNVAGAVRLLRPFAVDVSSGVESGHREKSADKIAAFIQVVRDADAK